MKFEKEQIISIKKDLGGLSKGKYEVRGVIPTGIGSFFNLMLRNVDDNKVKGFGGTLVSEAVELGVAEVFDSVEDLKAGTITNSSEWATQDVLKHIPLSFRARNSAEGDVWRKFYLDELNKNTLSLAKIEVKAENSSAIKDKNSYGANQVRPIKYHILVVVVKNLTGFGCDCLVYPAYEVVKRSLSKSGQHVLDAVACFNMKCDSSDVNLFGCSFKELESRIKEAYIKDHFDECSVVFRKIVEDRRKLYNDVVVENKRLWNKYVSDSQDLFGYKQLNGDI